MPYWQVLHTSHGLAALDLRDKAVFVGFSETLQPEQRDSFFTAFSQPDGLDLSGVEIAATAFANILEESYAKSLTPLAHLLVISLWGIALGLLLMNVPAAGLLPAAILAGLAYLWSSHHDFSQYNLWPPLIIPLVLQTPITLVLGLSYRYAQTRQERERIRGAFKHYVPAWVVDEMVRSRREISAQNRSRFGICLATDAEQYTQFAETLRSDELHRWLNQHYQGLFEPVTRYGGFISDVVGDAMLAVWTTTSANEALRLNACLATLAIVAHINQLDQSTEHRLRTRVGLHCGDIVLATSGRLRISSFGRSAMS